MYCLLLRSARLAWISAGQISEVIERRRQIEEWFRGRGRRRGRGQGAHKATNERVHGLGEGGATQHAQGLSGHAQLQHQQDSRSASSFALILLLLLLLLTRLFTSSRVKY